MSKIEPTAHYFAWRNVPGRSIEELAEAAIANETSKTREWDEVMPPPRRERLTNPEISAGEIGT